MALGQMQFDSYLNNTGSQPQQNQYLTGNPSTDPNANTVWMDQTQKSPTTGINGGGGSGQVSQSQPTTTPQQGTALGAISSGTYMPGGYDQNKWNDPNKHDPKYDVGHILSGYAPGTAGLDQAMNQLTQQGYTRVGKDSIYRPDVGVIDVGKSFGSGVGSEWQWLPQDQGGQQQGFIQGTQNNQNNPFMSFLQQLFGSMQGNPGNSTGGWAQPINKMPVQQGPNTMGPIQNQTPQNQMWNNALPQQPLTFGGYQNPDQTSTPQIQTGMVNNGWGKMIPQQQYQSFLNSGAMT